MGAQHGGFGVLGLEFIHNPRPQQTGGTQFGGLHKEVHADAEEKAEARREFIHVHTGSNSRAHIFTPVRKRECQLLHQIRARLLHVITRDRDRVELRHVIRGVFDDIADDLHRWFWRIDIGVAHHEFFQNIILNGA